MSLYEAELGSWKRQFRFQNPGDWNTVKNEAVRLYLEETEPSSLGYTLIKHAITVRSLLRTVQDVPPLALNSLTEEEKQHLTGFWEGDGSLHHSIVNHEYQFMLTQIETNSSLLMYFQKLLGVEDKELGGSGRERWVTITLRSQVLQLVELVSNYVVCRKRVEQIKRVTGNTNVVEHEPTWAWIAGFFDAEGYVGCGAGGYGLQVSISQRDHHPLYKIQTFTQSGTVARSQIVWYGESAWHIANNMYPLIHNQKKKEEMYALFAYNKRPVQ